MDTELDLASEIDYGLMMGGAEGLAFRTIVASGKNSRYPHHDPTSDKLEGALAISGRFTEGTVPTSRAPFSSGVGKKKRDSMRCMR